MLGWLMLQSMNALGYLVMTSMYNEDGLCGGGVWGLLYLIALSLLWPVFLSASLILRGGVFVTFEWNILLDLSGEAATKTFGSLMAKLLLQILSESTGAMAIGVIHGDEGMGDIPGIHGVQGVCRFCATSTRLTQELRLKV